MLGALGAPLPPTTPCLRAFPRAWQGAGADMGAIPRVPPGVPHGPGTGVCAILMAPLGFGLAPHGRACVKRRRCLSGGGHNGPSSAAVSTPAPGPWSCAQHHLVRVRHGIWPETGQCLARDGRRRGRLFPEDLFKGADRGGLIKMILFPSWLPHPAKRIVEIHSQNCYGVHM